MIYIPIFVNVALLLLFGYRYLFFSLVFRAIFVPFLIKNRHFSQVFVPHILIFKKLHLLLLSKMEAQAENGAKNH